MTSTSWKQFIVDLVRIKQQLAEVDTEGLWEHRLPAVAATEAELAAMEAHIGERGSTPPIGTSSCTPTAGPPSTRPSTSFQGRLPV